MPQAARRTCRSGGFLACAVRIDGGPLNAAPAAKFAIQFNLRFAECQQILVDPILVRRAHPVRSALVDLVESLRLPRRLTSAR